MLTVQMDQDSECRSASGEPIPSHTTVTPDLPPITIPRSDWYAIYGHSDSNVSRAYSEWDFSMLIPSSEHTVSSAGDTSRPSTYLRRDQWGLGLLPCLAILVAVIVWQDAHGHDVRPASAQTAHHASAGNYASRPNYDRDDDGASLIVEHLENARLAEAHGHSHWLVTTWIDSVVSITVIDHEARIVVRQGIDHSSGSRPSEICQSVANLTYLDRINNAALFEWIVILDESNTILYRAEVLDCF